MMLRPEPVGRFSPRRRRGRLYSSVWWTGRTRRSVTEDDEESLCASMMDDVRAESEQQRARRRRRSRRRVPDTARPGLESAQRPAQLPSAFPGRNAPDRPSVRACVRSVRPFVRPSVRLFRPSGTSKRVGRPRLMGVSRPDDRCVR